MEGIVKWFNRKKGFGFINGDDGQEYFVHYSALAQGTFIRDNDRVGFEPAETDRGKQAQKVVLLQKASDMEQAPAEEQPAQESFGDEEAKPEQQPAQEEAPVEEEAKPEEQPAEEQPAEEEQKAPQE